MYSIIYIFPNLMYASPAIIDLTQSLRQPYRTFRLPAQQRWFHQVDTIAANRLWTAFRLTTWRGNVCLPCRALRISFVHGKSPQSAFCCTNLSKNSDFRQYYGALYTKNANGPHIGVQTRFVQERSGKRDLIRIKIAWKER